MPSAYAVLEKPEKSRIARRVISALQYARHNNFEKAEHDINNAVTYIMTTAHPSSREILQVSHALDRIDDKLERATETARKAKTPSYGDYKRMLDSLHLMEEDAERFGIRTRHTVHHTATAAAVAIAAAFAIVLGALTMNFQTTGRAIGGDDSMIVAAFLLVALLYFWIERPSHKNGR